MEFEKIHNKTSEFSLFAVVKQNSFLTFHHVFNKHVYVLFSPICLGQYTTELQLHYSSQLTLSV